MHIQSTHSFDGKGRQNQSANRWRRVAVSCLIVSVLQSPFSAVAQVNPTITNQATYTYTDPASKNSFRGISSSLSVQPTVLTESQGRILDCGGQVLADYSGFSVALYEPNPNDPTGTELGRLVSLTPTELLDIPQNNIRRGVEPNGTNQNPFLLTNASRGVYGFLLDPNQGQTTPGKSYILVVNPPPNSVYSQRRIKLQIVGNTGSQQNNIMRYVATSLDGQPIATNGETTFTSTIAFVPDVEPTGLDLLLLRFDMSLCQPEQVRIIKTGDRATAQPGDTVIYRLSVRNLSDEPLDNIILTDTLPLGLQFSASSAKGEINGQEVSVNTEKRGSNIIFRTSTPLPPTQVLNIAYGAQLTPDAVRGSGRNSAIVNAQRVDNNFAIKDGPSTHQLIIKPGIVSNCGTIIGRVFVDKNFDGEQQSGEPGVPNAVIFLEDGNRIITDINGLFSVANVLPGYHTGVLDLSSIPNYTFAPNRKFRERNSQSRLVRLEPGGLVRMNFAVTPALREEVKK